MTENEIKNTKKWFEDFIETYALSNQETIEFKKAVACLEEIQQYRAIGLTPELIEAMQGHNVALINDLGEYQAIGTVDEFKAYKQGNCTNNCKHYDSTAEYVRNNAIDEFVKKICEKYTEKESKGNYRQYCCNIKQELADIAEQLKAGADNE